MRRAALRHSSPKDARSGLEESLAQSAVQVRRLGQHCDGSLNMSTLNGVLRYKYGLHIEILPKDIGLLPDCVQLF